MFERLWKLNAIIEQSRHSDIFKDMFEVGQPADEDNDAASRQVVVMYDKPADLSSLVKALYDGV